MKQSEIAKRLEAILSENETYASYTDEHILPVPQITTDALADQVRMIAESMVGLKELMMVYACAIKEMRTKFDVLNTEFNVRNQRNPISAVTTRLKSTASITEKLNRRGLPVTLESIEKNLNDVAGVRVICPFVDDIYFLVDCLLRQSDLELVQVKDYIKHPKPNGYRSLHLVVKIPVYFLDRKEQIPVEVQIRTIAMDFWASLEHQLRYKKTADVPETLNQQLYAVSEKIAALDGEMQHIHDQMVELVSGQSE